MRAGLEREGFDALIAYGNPATPGAVIYLTGYCPIFADAWCVVTLAACSLVTGADEYVHTGGECWLDERDVARVHRHGSQVARVLELVGGRARGVAVAGSKALSRSSWDAFASSDPSRRFTPSVLLDVLRSRKSDEEIALMQGAMQLADRAAVAFSANVEPGILETELAGQVENAMRAGGLTQPAFPLVLGSGPRSLDMTMLPVTRIIEEGDMVLLDCGARHAGYCSDIARSTVAGTPSAKQVELLNTVERMYRESVDLLRPGIEVRDLQERAAEVARDDGYDLIHELGHGIGCDVHEYPTIDTTDEVVVEEGVSGSVPVEDRPMGGPLFAKLERCDIVIAAKLDRLFRSALDALQVVEALKGMGVKLHLLDLGGDISGNGLSKLFLTIAAAFAEAERDRIRERIAQVKADQKARGRYLGGKVPFGFRRSNDGKLVPHEAEQEAIADMIALRSEGKPLRAIAETVAAKL